MSVAKNGDTVQLHYHGTLQDGEVFDSSRDAEPFEFEVGGGMVIAGFDDAVQGMEVGDTKSVTIEPDKAYGVPSPDLIGEVEKSHLPEGLDPEIGMTLQLKAPDGNDYPVRVTEVKETAIILDGNHPLAGETLTFELELVAINAE